MLGLSLAAKKMSQLGDIMLNTLFDNLEVTRGEGLHYSFSLMGLPNVSVPAPAVVNFPKVAIHRE